MLVRRSLLLGFSMASAVLGLVLSRDSWAQDVRHLCSEKYQAAKAAGTLNGDSWPQFYSRCTAEAKANPPAAEAAPAAAAPVDIRHICSEKYQAAKAAGTLNGEAWPQFYSRCTIETKANPPPAEVAQPPAPAPVVAAPPPPAPAPAPVVAAPPPPAPAPVAEAPVPPPVAAPSPVNPLRKPATKPMAPAAAAAPSTAVFPTAIAPAYANEKPGKARMKTCDDQYKANKATNANGGLKWIQKGGGYWSECNKRLKG
jgi:outer membrane biosynthesis protein TonB